jgi:Na+/proline symporter
LGVALALVLPSVASALTLFYSVMTAALFMPLLVGLFTLRPTAGHARVAVVASIAVTLALRLLLGPTASGAWLPALAGIGVAALVFGAAWLPSGLRGPTKG